MKLEVGKSYVNIFGNVCDIIFHDPITNCYVGRYRDAFGLTVLTEYGCPKRWTTIEREENRIPILVKEL